MSREGRENLGGAITGFARDQARRHRSVFQAVVVGTTPLKLELLNQNTVLNDDDFDLSFSAKQYRKQKGFDIDDLVLVAEEQGDWLLLDIVPDESNVKKLAAAEDVEALQAAVSSLTETVGAAGVVAISNSQTSLAGVVKLSGAGAVAVGSQTGNAFTISAPTQTVQTQSLVRAISYSNVTKDGTVRLTGAGAVVVGSDASGAVISAATQTVQTQSLVRAISASNTTLEGTVRITGAGNVTVGSDASGVVVSGSQSVQTQSLVGAISNSQASRSGTVNLSGAGIVTVGTQTGNAFTISASQSEQPVGSLTFAGNTTVGGGAAMSELPFASNIRLAGGNNITMSQASGGNSSRLAIDGENVGSLSPGGNTTGTTAVLPLNAAVMLAGGANVTLSQSSGGVSTRISISAASQSVQTQSIVRDVNIVSAAGGATSGTTADITSGTMTLAAGNSITLSQSGNAVTISGATTSQSVQPVGSLDLAGNTTGTMATVPFASNIELAGGNNITLSQASGASSSRITISAAAQSAAPVGSLDLAGNTTGTMATVPFASNIELAGGNNITLSQASGASSSRITISAASQSSETGSLIPGGNTTGTTASLPLYQNISLAGGPNITLSQASGASSTRVSISGASQSVQPVGSVDFAGNTTGTMATLPLASNVEIAGGNNITLSQASGASSSRMTISGADQSVQPVGSLDLTGNTTGTMATLPLASNVELAGGNNITLSQASGASSSRITISAASQSSHTGSLIPGGNTTGTTASLPLYANISLAGGNNITLSQASGASSSRITISAASQSAETGSLEPAGNTTGTTANLPFNANVQLAGGDNITLSQASGASSTNLTISGASQSVQPVGSLSFSGNTTVAGGGAFSALPFASNIRLAATNNITLSQQSGGSSTRITIEGADIGNLTLAGNTSGTMTALPFSGDIQLAGGANVTLSQSSGGGSSKISISAADQTSESGSLILGGNTTGTMASLPFYQNISLAGGNNITLSQSSGASSTRVTISAASQSVQTNSIVRDVNIVSAAAGATTGTTADITSGTMTLAAGNSITLSQAGGNALTLSGPTVQRAMRPVVGEGSTSGTTNDISSGTGGIAAGANITLSMHSSASSNITISASNPASISATELGHPGTGTIGSVAGHSMEHLPLAAHLSADSLALAWNNTTSTSSATGKIQLNVAVYTRSGSTLNRLASGSFSTSWSSGTNNSTNWGGFSGRRRYNIPIGTSLTPGEYWVGRQLQGATNADGGFMYDGANIVVFGLAGQTASSGVSGAPFGVGSGSQTVTGTNGSTINGSNIAIAALGHARPWAMLYDTGNNW